MKQLIIALLVIANIVATQNAIAQPTGKDMPPLKKRLTYDLTAQRMGRGDILEFTPMKIEFGLTVKTIGIVGPEPVPVDITVCPAIMPATSEFTCKRVISAKSGRSYKLTMIVPAPPAGKQSPLVIVALKPPVGEDTGQVGIPVTETEVRVDSAARYDVSIESFESLSLRSAHHDTVWLSLQGLIKANPRHPSENPEAANTAGFTWHNYNFRYGKVKDGVHIVKNFRVGPYDLVPERESDLRILFNLYNDGDTHQQEVAGKVADGFSKVGMLILGGWGVGSGTDSASFASQLDGTMQQFHAAATADCDGPLATDMVRFANTTEAGQWQNTLDSFTKANGSFFNTVPKIYRSDDGNIVCGDDGQYKVTYGIYRTSWKDWGFRPRW